MFRVSTLALASLCLFMGAFAAKAADLKLPPAPALAQSSSTLSEWNSGWYLRGDLGFSKDSQPPINADLSYSNNSNSKSAWAGQIGFGNQVSSWLRIDTTAEFSNKMNANALTTSTSCQTGAGAIYDSSSNIIGSSPIYGSCYGQEHSSLSRWNLMANAYADLGTFHNVTPYIGFGFGLSHSTLAGNVAYYYTGTSTTYNASWTDPYTGVAMTQNWNKTYAAKSTTQLAWALMGGVSIDITNHVKMDIGARYLNEGRLNYTDSTTGNKISKSLTSKQVKLGIRYMID